MYLPIRYMFTHHFDTGVRLVGTAAVLAERMDPIRRQVTDDVALALLEANELFRKMEREVPSQLISCFYYVASHNQCHKQAMEEDLGLSTSSASRLIDWLGKTHRLSKNDGFDLVEKYKDDGNWRRVKLRLTVRGEQLLELLKLKVYGTS